MAEELEIDNILSDDLADSTEDLGWQSENDKVQVKENSFSKLNNSQKKRKKKRSMQEHSVVHNNDPSKKKKKKYAYMISNRNESHKRKQKKNHIMVLIGSLSKFKEIYKDTDDARFLYSIFSNTKKIKH
ncbi:hypothetical protein RFI_07698, partial [Reticulomyxa filosa]